MFSSEATANYRRFMLSEASPKCLTFPLQQRPPPGTRCTACRLQCSTTPLYHYPLLKVVVFGSGLLKVGKLKDAEGSDSRMIFHNLPIQNDITCSHFVPCPLLDSPYKYHEHRAPKFPVASRCFRELTSTVLKDSNMPLMTLGRAWSWSLSSIIIPDHHPPPPHSHSHPRRHHQSFNPLMFTHQPLNPSRNLSFPTAIAATSFASSASHGRAKFLTCSAHRKVERWTISPGAASSTAT